jgi:hypothetical protein
MGVPDFQCGGEPTDITADCCHFNQESQTGRPDSIGNIATPNHGES